VQGRRISIFMNVSNSFDQAPAEPRPKLAITDSMALFALREGGDVAACAWLCQKYRPLVAHVARRAFAAAPMPDEVVDECLQRAIALLKNDPPVISAAGVFARTALQVSCEWTRSSKSAAGNSELAA
jgi:hypothetical protein